MSFSILVFTKNWPGTPAEVMNIGMPSPRSRDPELKEGPKKLMMTVENLLADECLKVLNNLLSQPEDIVKESSKNIKFWEEVEL